jgi:hypothetical protein
MHMELQEADRGCEGEHKWRQAVMSYVDPGGYRPLFSWAPGLPCGFSPAQAWAHESFLLLSLRESRGSLVLLPCHMEKERK